MAGLFGTEFTRNTQTQAAANAEAQEAPDVVTAEPGAARLDALADDLTAKNQELWQHIVQLREQIRTEERQSGELEHAAFRHAFLGVFEEAPTHMVVEQNNCKARLDTLEQEVQSARQEMEQNNIRMNAICQQARDQREAEHQFKMAALEKVGNGQPVTDEEWESISPDVRVVLTRPRG